MKIACTFFSMQLASDLHYYTSMLWYFCSFLRKGRKKKTKRDTYFPSLSVYFLIYFCCLHSIIFLFCVFALYQLRSLSNRVIVLLHTYTYVCFTAVMLLLLSLLVSTSLFFMLFVLFNRTSSFFLRLDTYLLHFKVSYCVSRTNKLQKEAKKKTASYKLENFCYTCSCSLI